MFDYSKLEGRIVEKYKNKKKFCNAVGINYWTFTSKLRGEYQFSSDEIINITEALEIPYSDINVYFFTQKV